MAPDDYSGLTLVRNGTLLIGSNTSLGSTTGANSGTLLQNGATLEVAGVNNLAEPITCDFGTILCFGTNTLTGSLVISNQCFLVGYHEGFFDDDLLQLNGVISGPGHLGIGGGRVRLGGSSPNTFTGNTTIGNGNDGIGFPVTVELAKPNNVLALPGEVNLANFYDPSTNKTVLRNLQDGGVYDVRIGHVGQWLLNGHVAAPHSLTFYDDGSVDSQAGQLQMTTAPGTNRFYAIASLSHPNYTAQILGNLVMLAPTDEFMVEFGPNLQIGALISGPGNFSKIGPGTATLAGTAFNSYSGETFVNLGTLQLNKPLATTAVPGVLEIGAPDGSTAAVARNLNSYQIVGNIYVHSGSIYDVNGQVENTDYLTMDGNATVETGGGYLSLKTGAGITVNPGVNTTATLLDHLYLDAGNHVITVGSGATQPGLRDFVITADIGETTPTASLQKEGPGQMRLSGNNSYSGPTYINHGKLFPTSIHALGATNGPTIVTNDATLVLDGGITIPDELLILNSSVPGLESRSGSNTWNGPMTLGNSARIAVSNILTIYGVINGNGGLTKVSPGTLFLDGFGENTYGGDTFVNEGTLALRKVQIDSVSVPHNVTIGTGLGGPPATLLMLNEGALAGRVTVNDGGFWNLNGAGQFFQGAAIIGSPTLTLNGSAAVSAGIIGLFDDGSIVVNPGNNTTATVAAQLFFVNPNVCHINVSSGNNLPGKPECVLSGLISQFFGDSGLVKEGLGTLRLTGTNTYTGTNFINGGSLWVDGVQPQSAVQINVGTLGGYGTVGSVYLNSIGALVSPGESSGILTCSNFNAGATPAGALRVELNGATPGTGYDQVNARGTVSLTGLSLNASLNYNSASNDTFTIVNNDGSDAVTGTFTGLPEGKKLYVGKELFQISYAGGSGNDVVLSRLTTPPPPNLFIERASSSTVRLLWATNDPPFSLQTATNLLTANWTNATPSPTIIGATNVVTNSIIGNQFYRLSNP
jgi:autotransporter-associated beta strand protein